MDAGGIQALARLIGSPTEVRRRNVNIVCPLAPVRHRDRASLVPSLAVKVESSASPVLCRSTACGARGTLLGVFEEANKLLGGVLDDVVAWIGEHDARGLAGAFARLRDGDLDDGGAPRREPDGQLARYVARCSGLVPRYVLDRGLARADVNRWRVGYDSALRRATFPVWDERGVIVGVARRAVDGAEPKFFDWPGQWKRDVFYGEHLVDTTRDGVVLVEGVMATIMASRTLPNVLGVLGAGGGSLSPARVGKLRRWVGSGSVTLMFDADAPGRAAVWGSVDPKGRPVPGLRETLRPYFPVRVATLPDGADPADVPADVVRDAYARASYVFA